ncbi:MAG: hypothetical protein NZ934_04590 [Hadesarchaea archaeon]|nr:hypothetical protein [Hadesarchaea archaeon]
MKRDIDVVLTRLHYARSRDLSAILHLLYIIARDDGVHEVLQLVPTMEEVEEMMMEEE